MAGGDPEQLRVVLTVHHRATAGGGAAGSTMALAEELERRGHDVRVVGLGLLRRDRGGTRDALAFPHAVAREVHRLLRDGALDVLDASTGDLAYVRRRVVASAPVAVFTRSHGLESLGARRRQEGARTGELDLRWRYRAYHGGFRLLEVARSLRVADGALVLNDAEARFLRQTLGIPSSRVWMTTPVVPPLPAPSERPTRDVLVLGPCSWRKGGDVALRVLDALLRGSDRLTASWHGLDEPESVARSLGPGAALEVGGRYDRSALASLLASHRVLLVASRFEGMPVTVLESLSAGVAVVGTDVPGVHDLLAGGAGVLVPDGHVVGLTAAVRRLLADDAARAKCAVAGRAVAASRSRGSVADALESTYREVLAAKCRSA